MSLNESVDIQSVDLIKDVELDQDRLSNDFANDKSKLCVNSKKNPNISPLSSTELKEERLMMDDSNCDIADASCKKPLKFYEKLNGFNHLANHETVPNGEVTGPLTLYDEDSKHVSDELTSDEVNPQQMSNIHGDNHNNQIDVCDNPTPVCTHDQKDHSDSGNVEELIDKLTRKPLLDEKCSQLSLPPSETADENCSQLSLPHSETGDPLIHGISYVIYESERQMPDIMRLITKDLSEPYSIYTYRYFIHNWPKLCFLAMDKDTCVGAIVCKLDVHKKMVRRGYIAMLAVDSEYRRRKIGSTLVTKAIHAMIRDDCDEVVLETEITNQAALHLYENLGFVRDKRLFRYYLNGVDALRLKLWLR